MPRRKELKPIPHLEPDDDGLETELYDLPHNLSLKTHDPSFPEKNGQGSEVYLPNMLRTAEANGQAIRDYAQAALSGILARIGLPHPTMVDRVTLSQYAKTCFDIAEIMLDEERGRYG